MLEIFMHDKKWRIKIVNETLEFDDEDDFKEILDSLVDIKYEFRPHK